MVHKLQQRSRSQPTNHSDQAGTGERRPPDCRAVLDQAETLLRAGQPRQALDLLARSKADSPWATNATGVCLLRLGQADRAVELFRNLVLSGGLFLRREVPTAWKVNFATALLMADNLAGGVRLLGEIQDEDHPGVRRLRAALQNWQGRLSVWEKIWWSLGGRPARRVELDFLPGELGAQGPG
jgi:predicted Zn-dependent protease